MALFSLLPFALAFGLLLSWQEELELPGALLSFCLRISGHRKATAAQGPQARLRWQLCLSHRSFRLPAGSLPRQCSLGLGGSGGSPRSETRASSAASSLPPAWHPPLFP